MNRLEKFHSFKSHPVHGKPFRSLNREELTLCEKFIAEHDGKNKDEYAHVAARWMLDSVKPRHYSAMQVLVFLANG